ncbi:Auxin-induced in root cultures protein 12 [Apostasia shenzhenica]|uniref:Cytochrome b561 and DOMON domain-containing protein n=1 Tax=Apostasia shenzhenica TaxID=1088818 RepID=A0A2I0ADI7_9ASPA|nr:Auxin-induced in root cultures protein 12 [Apostasia shenzhenica]
MATPLTPFLLISLTLALFRPSFSQKSCSGETFSQNRVYTVCNSLPQLSANLHWTYHPANSTVDVAYRAPQSADGWVAWALNPTTSGMRGAQAIFAFFDSNNAMTTITCPLPNTQPTIRNTSLSYNVYSMASEFSNNVMTIYATIELPNNKTQVNQVWQASNQFSNGLPYGHLQAGPNILSEGLLDLLSGELSSTGNSRIHLKNRHGVLNAVSWGILLPIGAIIARYLRMFKSADPAWFYLHVGCQCSAYIVGVAGWGIGIKLGNDSKGITYNSHRNIGIALFILGTLQVFALFLRPNKDHKYRLYWNIYHHLTGYTVIVLSVVNIFKGFDILEPGDKWKHAYIAIISTLAGIAAILEAVTWGIVLKRRRSVEKFQNGANGATSSYGYGGGANQGA